MRIHKEGYPTLLLVFILLVILNTLAFRFLSGVLIIPISFLILSFAFYLFILVFFRQPNRKSKENINHILAPADGEVVVIEETYVEEFFRDKRLQISIFMSPLNVHSNYNPVSGTVKYYRYHPGRYHVAWLPKSSTENERTTYVIESENKLEILIRQVAGFVARRIVHYNEEGDFVQQGKEFGFIKFGSRVDIFLPAGTKVNVKLNEKVTGARTVIAEF